MKETEAVSGKYFVREMEDTWQYQYTKITDALIRKGKNYEPYSPLQANQFYKEKDKKYFEISIPVNNQKYIIS